MVHPNAKADAEDNNGQANYADHHYTQAYDWWIEAADQGNVVAEANLGMLYALGQGVSQSYTQAAYWWKQAAHQNNEQAQYNLARLYYHGWGVSQSRSKATYWLRKSKENGG